ncbi:hypothetical protein XH86_39290 (plasmid) [Bradyrhizobium guangdongense]|uniref:Uncharacterized protein n=1 Tax=Bradyrhizobium guangdongense TaxID=1325090 RepID=A0A7S7ZVZ7_9BRAD|nr:hypothetical protein XH86_39290 [Bradyrhizobium guangdongense]
MPGWLHVNTQARRNLRRHGNDLLAVNFAIPSEGIEQKARKTGGSCAEPEQIRTDVDRHAAEPRVYRCILAAPRKATASTIRT